MKKENIKIILIKELKHYLNTPPSYVLAIVFLILLGYFFAQPLFLINQATLNSLIDIAPLLLTFFIPALSMKLIAEEKKTQTIELLLTLPFKEEEIIIGKYIAAAIIILSTIFFTFSYPLTLYFLSSPDSGHIIGSYLAIVFTSLAYLSIGIYASTISSSQITAFIIGFSISFIFYLLGKIVIFAPLNLQNLLTYLAIDSHISNLSRGVIDLKDLVYFLSIIVLFNYLSVKNIKRSI